MASDSRSAIARAYRPGDRLYGLNKQREPYQDEVEQHFGGESTAAARSTATVDRLNNRLKISMPIDADDYESFSKGAAKHPTDIAYLQHLAEDEVRTGKSMHGRDQNARIRLSSKRNIDFTQAQGRTVHFILDEVDMKSVVAKRNYSKDPDEKDVTASELRYLHRNWGRLQDSVKFYKGGAEAPAPWEAEADLWKGYKTGGQVKHSFPNVPQRRAPPRMIAITPPAQDLDLLQPVPPQRRTSVTQNVAPPIATTPKKRCCCVIQ
jgi:hypothetical protein